MVALAILIIIVAVAMLIFFAVYRRSKCVKRSGLLYLVLILVGVILFMVSIILWSVEQSMVWCTLKAACAMLGLALIIGYP